jgi:hypothetical protein
MSAFCNIMTQKFVSDYGQGRQAGLRLAWVVIKKEMKHGYLKYTENKLEKTKKGAKK